MRIDHTCSFERTRPSEESFRGNAAVTVEETKRREQTARRLPEFSDLLVYERE